MTIDLEIVCPHCRRQNTRATSCTGGGTVTPRTLMICAGCGELFVRGRKQPRPLTTDEMLSLTSDQIAQTMAVRAARLEVQFRRMRGGGN